MTKTELQAENRIFQIIQAIDTMCLITEVYRINTAAGAKLPDVFIPPTDYWSDEVH